MSRTRTLLVHGPAPPLSGVVRVPGDKSITHRALFLGAMADGRTTVTNGLDAEDIDATIAVLTALGARIERTGDRLVVARPIDHDARGEVALHCGESGTTARLLFGLLAGLDRAATVDGADGLRARPMARVLEPLARMGLEFDAPAPARLPLRVRGKRITRCADHVLDVASAQVKTALLFAGTYADGVTRVTEPVASRDHTERMLPAFGIECARAGTAVEVRGIASPQGAIVDVPGDVSAATALIAAALCVPGSNVRLPDVGVNPTRIGALDALRAMGAVVRERDVSERAGEPRGTLDVVHGPLRATPIAATELPRLVDEVPLLCGIAATAVGTSRFEGLAELRVKESDRVAATAATLRAFGADVEIDGDAIVVRGKARLRAADVQTWGDHRIAFLAVALALAAEGTSRVHGIDAITKSYPGYVDALRALLGDAAARTLTSAE